MLPSQAEDHPNQPSDSDATQIRHSGSVQVRGRIRRVWRPRHLELLADGHLKYYDLDTGDLKYTLQISSARILDGTTLRDLHVGLPRGAFGFLIRGQRVWNEETETLPSHQRKSGAGGSTFHPYASTANTALVSDSFVLAEAPEPVRDYLCAVDSLEEAQMWVVALQWAASLADSELLSWWKVDYCSSGGDTPRDLNVTTRNEERGVETVSVQSGSEMRSKESRILVAKVTGCTVVRVSKFSFELAYGINVMLLCTSTANDSSKGYVVEEWSLVRTAHDFGVVEPLQHPIPTWKTMRTAHQIQKTISILDSVLRSWVLSADMVRNPAFQRFLGLEPCTPENKWWQQHNPSAVRSTHTEYEAFQPPDLFVQGWLQRTHSETANTRLTQNIIAWRPHAWWVGGLAIAAVPLARRLLASIPSVSVRVDCLLISWAGAAYFGYRQRCAFGDRRVKAHRPKHLTKIRDGESTTTKQTELLPSGTHNMQEIVGEATVEEGDDDDEESDGEAMEESLSFSTHTPSSSLSSPLPEYPSNNGVSCWSQPPPEIFHVRGSNYFHDKIKVPSLAAPLRCSGVDMWLTDNPVRHIARHPALAHHFSRGSDVLVVNFLLPFANFVAYFDVPPLSQFPPKLASTWNKFLQGDQQYRDARLKLLPVVMEGPWIVKTAVGPGKSPALLGKVIPLQYFFSEASKVNPAIYEVDIIITASSIAKGILSVVKSQTRAVTIGFALIIEAAEQNELPENILCSFQVHSLHVEDCPILPSSDLGN